MCCCCGELSGLSCCPPQTSVTEEVKPAVCPNCSSKGPFPVSGGV